MVRVDGFVLSKERGGEMKKILAKIFYNETDGDLSINDIEFLIESELKIRCKVQEIKQEEQEYYTPPPKGLVECPNCGDKFLPKQEENDWCWCSGRIRDGGKKDKLPCQCCGKPIKQEEKQYCEHPTISSSILDGKLNNLNCVDCGKDFMPNIKPKEEFYVDKNSIVRRKERE